MSLLPYDSRRRSTVNAAIAMARGVRLAMKYKKPLTELGRRLADGLRKRKRNAAMPYLPTTKQRQVFIGDPASYRQLGMTKRRYGRKLSTKFRDLKLMQTVAVPLRFHFGRANDINAAEGPYWLSQQQYNATSYRLPVYLFNLFTVSQLANGLVDTNKQAYPGFELYRDTTTGRYSWGPVPGLSVTDGSTATYVKERIAPSASTDHIIGRKGLLDWTRARVCIWGKKQNPTYVRVRLIRFTDEEFCPEFSINRTTGFTPTSVSYPKVNEYWENQIKYLLNGPQGSAPRSDRKQYVKVLKEFIVKMNPIDASAETAESDPRGHMRHIDLFNRWGRVLDFTEPDPTNAPSMEDVRNVNKFEQPTREYSGYLRRADQAVYVMIDSVQPYEEVSSSNALPRPRPSTDAGLGLTASFDITIDTNYSVIEKAV